MRAVPLRPDEHIILDGTLDHPAWQRAPVYDRFVQHDPENGVLPKDPTRVQVLFDKEAIYVGVTAIDPQPEQIRAPLVRHDNVNRTQDFIALYIDAIGKRQSAQFFRVNTAGSLSDGMHTAVDDNEDFSPDFDFDAATARNDQGYTAVFRIPFASLRFAAGQRPCWRIMVARRMPRDQAYLFTSVPVPTDAPAFIATLQPLEGIELPADSRFFSVRPSLTYKHTTTSNPGLPTDVANPLLPSLDVKWRAAPELVVDGTIKPDFSQVALDVPQLSGNSQFALYFPEKRPFFFESSDLLRSPTDALYTRSFTQPRWGARATWRDATLAGTVMAVDDEGGGETLLPYAYGTNTALQPASTALAGRVRGDVDEGARLQLGGVLAARHYIDERGDNTVLGPDFAWQVDDLWRVRGQWLASDTTAQPDANGSLSRGAQTTGDSLVLRATRQTDRTQFDFTAQDIGPAFRDDTGFVNQVGIRSVDLHQAHVWRQVGGTNELWFNLREGQMRDRLNGQVIQGYITPNLFVDAPHNTDAWIEYHGLSRVRTASGGALLSENYWKGEVTTTPVQWMPILDANLSLGRMADYLAGVVRRGGQISLTAKTRPLPSLELEPSAWGAWLRRDDGVLTYRETASQLLGVWHFDARRNLRLIVQRTTYDRKAEPGVLADQESGLASSLTFTWRRSMGTVLYVGASRSHSGVGVENYTHGTEAFIKLQVDVDEARSLF